MYVDIKVKDFFGIEHTGQKIKIQLNETQTEVKTNRWSNKDYQ